MLFGMMTALVVVPLAVAQFDTMPIDTGVVAPIAPWLLPFGIPVSWLPLAMLVVWGQVNNIKSLAPRLFQSRWYPAVAGVVSGLYAWGTLRPNMVAVAVGGVVLFGIQWAGWVIAKRGAVAAGLRE